MRQSMMVRTNDLTFLVSIRHRLRQSCVPTNSAAPFSIACNPRHVVIVREGWTTPTESERQNPPASMGLVRSATSEL
jgi:hypothetical protein